MSLENGQAQLAKHCQWPYLSIRSQVVQGGDIQPEFARLCELAKARAATDELIVTCRTRQMQQGLRHVVHSVLVFPEAVGPIRPVDQQLDVAPDTKTVHV